MDGAVTMSNVYTVKSKNDVTAFLVADQKACFGTAELSLEKKLRNPFKQKLFKFFKLLRQYEYLCCKRDNCKNSIVSKIISLRIKKCDIKKNRLSLLLGVEVAPFRCGKGARICHPNVVINGFVGENCTFHGSNIIGNKKTGQKDAVPKIGNNVDIGAGAIIIGDVVIADNCVIGAGAVVTKSFTSPGTVIAGVPAKEIKGESNE